MRDDAFQFSAGAHFFVCSMAIRLLNSGRILVERKRDKPNLTGPLTGGWRTHLFFEYHPNTIIFLFRQNNGQRMLITVANLAHDDATR